jgi:regulator of protease activity HflC (stomatin/prohibitin superfamily)
MAMLILLSLAFFLFAALGFSIPSPWSFTSGAVALTFLGFSIALLSKRFKEDRERRLARLSQDEVRSIYQRPGWYWHSVILMVWLPFWGTLGIITLWAISNYGVSPSPALGGIPWNWGLVVLALVGLEIIMSTRIVMPSQIGVRRFLGIQLHDLKPGPHLAPWPFFWIRIFPANVIEKELPGDPEDVVDAEANEALQEGQVRPIRVNFGDSAQSEEAIARYKAIDPEFDFPVAQENDPLNTAVAIPIQIGVRYRIRNAIVFAEQIRTIRSANKQFLDIVVAWVNRELVKMTARDAQNNIEPLNRMLRHEIEIAVGEIPDRPVEEGGTYRPDWGIDVVDIFIKGITPGHSLNKKIQTIAEKRAEARGRVTMAKADATYEKETRTARGAGDAAALEAVGTARNTVFRLLTKPKKEGGAGIAVRTLYAGAVAESVATNVKTLVAVGPEGMGSLAGSVAAAAAILKGDSATPAPTPPTPAAGGTPPTPTPPTGGTPPAPAGGGTPPRGGGGGGRRKKRRNRGGKGGTTI